MKNSTIKLDEDNEIVIKVVKRKLNLVFKSKQGKKTFVLKAELNNEQTVEMISSLLARKLEVD